MTNLSKLYTANQPLLFPHIYMMNRYANVGHYVSMNTAQFTKFGHQSRVELMDKHGKEQLLIIPLRNRSYMALNEVELVNADVTKRKMINTMDMLYGSSPYYKQYRDGLVEAIQCAGSASLADFNNSLLRWLFRLLDMPIQWHDVERILPVRPEHPSDWVAEMGKVIGCDTYLGGATAQAAYLQDESFSSRGMGFIAQSYGMPSYKRYAARLQNKATVSCLDPLFYLGVDGLLELINLPAY